ncbi:MAG: hypothetical protein AAGA32_05040 [Pseudomonadota bacterium]
MRSREPSGHDILWTYCAGVVGAYFGGVASVLFERFPQIELLGAGLGGAAMLLVVKLLHNSRAALGLLCVCAALPAYPAYQAIFDDPYRNGQILQTTIASYRREGPGLDHHAISVLPAGTSVRLIGRSWRRIRYNLDSGNDNEHWREVEAAEGTGWIYGSLLTSET